MVDFIVFGGSSIIVTAVLRTIRSFSNGKIIVLGDHDTMSLRWSFLYQKHIAISLKGSDDDKCIDILNAVAKNSPHSVLIPCDCDAIRMTNRMRDRLAVKTTPVPATVLLDMFDDKWQFYEFCQRNALPVPDTIYIGIKDQCEFDTVVDKVGLPFILKPSNEAGSKGIEVIHSKAHYEQTVSNNPRYVFEKLIAQRYIEGTDIDISLYAIHGKLSACAIQKSEGGEIHFTTHPYLTSIAERLCTKTAYHGVMHVDARIERDTGKVYLIESNPRFWASMTAAAMCGLNFMERMTTASSDNHALRQLTSGSVSIRPPFIEPSSWAALVFDTGVRGRMLRAMTFDFPALFSFIKILPVMIRSTLKRRISRRSASDEHIAPIPVELKPHQIMPCSNLLADDAIESDEDSDEARIAVRAEPTFSHHSAATAMLS